MLAWACEKARISGAGHLSLHVKRGSTAARRLFEEARPSRAHALSDSRRTLPAVLHSTVKSPNCRLISSSSRTRMLSGAVCASGRGSSATLLAPIALFSTWKRRCDRRHLISHPVPVCLFIAHAYPSRTLRQTRRWCGPVQCTKGVTSYGKRSQGCHASQPHRHTITKYKPAPGAFPLL